VSPQSNGEFLKVSIKSEPSYIIYDRRVYSLGDLFGQVGGLYSIVYLIGLVFTYFFADKLFRSSIMSEVYEYYKPTPVSNSKISPSNLDVTVSETQEAEEQILSRK
jgi:hypothetical protein